MSNKIDLLLKIDKTKLARPTQEVEIKRLSEALGEPFTITCQALSPDEFKELQEGVSMSTEGEINVDKNIQINTLIKGVKDPDLTNQKVIEYYGAVNAAEAVDAIFLPGETQSIYTIITQLSGFGKDAVKEIKNS